MDDFSEELLEEERRGRTKRIALIAILSAITLVGVIVAGLEIYGYIMHDKTLKTADKGLNLKLPMIRGPEDAKVKIEATIPQSGCLDGVAAFLLELEAWCPDKIRLELYSMHEPDGQAILKKYNAECASVFINGKRTITYTKDGVKHDVVFTGSIGTRFEFGDVVYAVKQALIKAYGEAPYILDELPPAKEEWEITRAVMYMQDTRLQSEKLPETEETSHAEKVALPQPIVPPTPSYLKK